MGLEVTDGTGMAVTICYPLLVMLLEQGHGPVLVSQTQVLSSSLQRQQSRAAAPIQPSSTHPSLLLALGKGAV